MTTVGGPYSKMYKTKVKILGTSGGLSTTDKASAGILISQSKKKRILLDCGDLTSLQIQKAGIDPNSIKAIFISHPHLDHYIGLPILVLHQMFLAQRTEPLMVAAPQEVIDALGYMFKNNPLPSPFHIGFVPLRHGRTFFPQIDMDLSVTSFRVNHGIDSFGFEINDMRTLHKIIYSGDTIPIEEERYSGANLMIHEATFASDFDKPIHGHTKILELEALAKKYYVKKLVLTHMSGRYQDDWLLTPYGDDYIKLLKSGINVWVAEDMDEYEV